MNFKNRNSVWLVFLGATSLFPSWSGAETIKVLIKGMVCSFCAQGIRVGLEQSPEIEKFSINMDEKAVMITPKEGKKLNDASIIGMIKDTGYDVDKIVRETPPTPKIVEAPVISKKAVKSTLNNKKGRHSLKRVKK